MEAFQAFLRHFPHFQPEVFAAVRPFLSIREINAGDFFLRSGNVCRHIAFVEKGLLRIFYLHDGKEITKCFCKAGTISTSYSSMITQSESDFSIQAIEPTSLIVFSYETLQQLYEQSLFWQQVGRLAAENEFIQEEHHQRFLKDLNATERYQHILENDRELLQSIPLLHLATYLQIAPETLSRIRNKLART